MGRENRYRVFSKLGGVGSLVMSILFGLEFKGSKSDSRGWATVFGYLFDSLRTLH